MINYVDEYCHAGNILVHANPSSVYHAISDGETHGRWTTSLKKPYRGDIWVGTSMVTGRQNYVEFICDSSQFNVDYGFTNNGDLVDLPLRASARVVAGSDLGYPENSAIGVLYAWRLASMDAGTFLKNTAEHSSEMYRLKALLEQSTSAQDDRVIGGNYLHSSSDIIAAGTEKVWRFLSDPEAYGQWTWGRSPRVKTGYGNYRVKSEFGGPDTIIKTDVDEVKRMVDYLVGHSEDRLSLYQSIRVFNGSEFGYSEHLTMVTMSLWRRADYTDFAWDRELCSQEEELALTKAILERT